MALFLIQRFGTSVVGLLFSPIASIWCVTSICAQHLQHSLSSGLTLGDAPRTCIQVQLHNVSFDVCRFACNFAIGVYNIFKYNPAMFKVRCLAAAVDPAVFVRSWGNVKLSTTEGLTAKSWPAGPVAALSVHLPGAEWQDGLGIAGWRTVGLHRCGLLAQSLMLDACFLQSGRCCAGSAGQVRTHVDDLDRHGSAVC